MKLENWLYGILILALTGVVVISGCVQQSNVGFCTHSQLETFEDNGLWTSRSSGYELSETISDRARIGMPLLIQGNLWANYGKDRNNLTEGLCHVENGQINIEIYKNGLELFSDSVMTNQYGDWESEKFVPEEIGDYIIVISWHYGNTVSEEEIEMHGILEKPKEIGFNVSEEGVWLSVDEEEVWLSIEIGFHVSE